MRRFKVVVAAFRSHELNNRPIQSLWSAKAGSSLVEVMVSCLIFAIITIAGAEYIYRGQATLVVQKNRRIALWAANSELEKMRASIYSSLSVGTSTGTVYIGNTARDIITKIENGSGSAPSECRRVTVSVGYYGDSTNTDRVTVVTSRSPY